MRGLPDFLYVPLHYRWRRAAERAVAGDLPATDEVGFRGHLRACVPCRLYYDRLSLLVERLPRGMPRTPAEGSSALGWGQARSGTGDAGSVGEIPARRERERLLQALDPVPAAEKMRPHGAAASARRRPTWRLALLVLAPVVALIVVRAAFPGGRARVPDGPAGEVTWRGSGDARAPNTAVSLLVYAAPKPTTAGAAAAPVRLAADFPQSGEGQVSRAEYVQFGVRGLPVAAYTVIVGVDAQGGFHQYVPRPGAALEKLAPGTDARPLGVSFDVAGSHPPGRLLLFALFSTSLPDVARIRAAAARIDRPAARLPRLDLPFEQVAGALIVTP